MKTATLLLVLAALTMSPAFAQGVSVAFQDDVYTIADGQTRTLTALLVNEGPEAIELTPTVTLPDTMVLGLAPEPLTLGPNESRPVFFSVLAPRHTLAGDYEVRMDVAAAGITTAEATASLQVPQRTSIELQLEAESVGDTPSSRLFEIGLVNSGNTTKTVRLETQSSSSTHARVEPSTVELAPGETVTLHVVAESSGNVTSAHRLQLRATDPYTGEALANLRLGYTVLANTAQLRETHRELDFSVRLSYTPGANFTRPGPEGFGVRVAGGGLLDAKGNRRVRASVSVSGSGYVSVFGAYTSETLDVIIGNAGDDYSELSHPAYGYGVTLEARPLGDQVSFGAYVLGEKDFTAFTGIGAQVAGGAQGLAGSLQFTYDFAAQRGILSAAGSVNSALAGSTMADGEDLDDAEGLDEAEAEDDLVESVKSDLDEAVEGLPGADEADGTEEVPVDVAAELDVALSAPLATVGRWSASAEAAVDTISGAAGRGRVQAGVGPLDAWVDIGGTTEGFKGANQPLVEWGAGATLATGLGDGSLGVGATYRAIDRFTPTGDLAAQSDALGLGLGWAGEGGAFSLRYSSTVNANATGAAWVHGQRFGVNTRAHIGGFSFTADAVWRTQRSSASHGALTESSIDLTSRVSAAIPGGTIRAETELEYDLASGSLRNLQAEAITVFDDVASLQGDVSFGFRYRWTTDYQWVTGLARWAGTLTPNVHASAGLQGTLAYLPNRTSKALATHLSTTTLLLDGHRLGLNGQLRVQEGGNPSFTLGASYTVPFSVAVGRIEGYGDVKGVVLNDSGEPVPGIELSIGRAAVVSGVDGRFEVRGLPVGDHVLLAGAALDGWAPDPDLPIQVTVEDRAITELRLTLHAAATVAGQVTLATPSPEPGIVYGSGDRVRDERVARGLTIRLVGESREYVATLNSRGAFTVPNVMPGVYVVEVVEDLGSLYSVEISEPVLTLAPGQSAQLEVTVNPLLRRVLEQETGVAGEGETR